MSHGSDLDVWANKENSKSLANSFKDRSIFKFFPKYLARKLIIAAVQKQFLGLSASHSVIYFPAGFNKAGDKVVGFLREAGVGIFERYDVSFEPLNGVARDFKKPGEKTIIFSGVRFLYLSFPDGNVEYSKGNDIIIRGLAEYWKRNKKIEVHFVEKGEDVESAKKLCVELGIESVVIWHKEMPFNKLIDIYLQSDICFDQMGAHWMGAIGAYALFLGKPLITNVNKAVELGVLPASNPILSSINEKDVVNALVKLEDESYRRVLSAASKKFVEHEMGCKKLIEQLFYLD